MKISFENFISKIKKEEIETGVFLLFGNESGKISYSIQEIYGYFNKTKNILEKKNVYEKIEKLNEIEKYLENKSLFGSSNFLLINSPTEKLHENIMEFNPNDSVVVINGEKLKSNSKLKIFFDTHKKFISISCYTIQRSEKINIINEFISINDIKLDKDVYWFIVENISDDYLIIKSELEKLNLNKNKKLKISDANSLFSKKNTMSLDDLFFKCANGQKDFIIKQTENIINTPSVSYDIIRNIKKFIQIFSNAILEKDSKNIDILTNTHLPKYLFMKKDLFKKTLLNINSYKVIKINQLIQKTENLLRKNEEQNIQITQRFLLNVMKILK